MGEGGPNYKGSVGEKRGCNTFNNTDLKKKTNKIFKHPHRNLQNNI